MKNRILCVIPARYASTRLPAKPLCEINGLPLIMWAYNAAKKSKAFDRICVATDDTRILEAVHAHGGEAELTSSDHISGTDRVAEVADRSGFEYIVNLQGDEPCMPPDLLVQFAEKLISLDDNSLLTCVSNATIELKDDPNVVKAVLNTNGEALYFSRSAIPYDRDEDTGPILSHWGIYGFTAQSLSRFRSFPPGRLEQREKLEQLRALENGMRIVCIETHYASCGIDTPSDLAAFRARMEGSSQAWQPS